MADDPKTANDRFNEEVINQKKLDVIDELVSDDMVDHIPMPGQGPGREGVKQAIAGFFEAFSDLRIEVVEEVTSGELVAQVVRFTGTHDGPLMGMPATGRSVSFLGADFGRVRDGRFVEHWGFVDQGGLMQQLGMSPGGPPG